MALGPARAPAAATDVVPADRALSSVQAHVDRARDPMVLVAIDELSTLREFHAKHQGRGSGAQSRHAAQGSAGAHARFVDADGLD